MKATVLRRSFLVLGLALSLGACGRTTALSAGGDSGINTYDARPPVIDLSPPPPDGLILPDGLWPPPPDQGPPPLDTQPATDLIPPPPWDLLPPADIKPPPPSDKGPVGENKPPVPDKGPAQDIWPPPPPDLTPPPDTQPPVGDTGLCVPTCTQMCQILIACGLYTGGYSKCASECILWPASTTSCMTKLFCSGTSSCMPYSSCLVPGKLPDLVVSSLTAAVASGSNTVTYTIKTCNQGTDTAGGFYVDLYYDLTSAPTTKQYGNQYKQYQSLAVGACVTDTFTRTNTPAGTYQSYAQVDTDAYVSESSETNNVNGPVKVTVTNTPPPLKGPDLVIKSITASTGGPSGFTIVRYRFNICNNGTTASSASQVDVYYNLSAAPKTGAAGDQSTSVPALQPGNCVNRDIYRTNVSSGTYNSYGQVDTKNAVSETDETNNIYGPVKVTVGTSPGADLTISSFTYQAYAYNTILYTVQVCNNGTGSSGATTLHVYDNQSSAPKQGQSGDRSTQVPILQAGQCTTRYLTRIQAPSGTYTSWAYIDPLNGVTETNENNNVSGPLKVSVGGTANKPDLYFKSFDATLSSGSILYTMVICNQGLSAATPFRVDVYYNRTSAPTAGLAGNQFTIVPMLNAAACTTVTRTYSNPPSGTYNSYAQVDTSGWVSETNENNNITGPKTITKQSTVACLSTCIFAVGCGLFSASQWQQCILWCQSLSGTTYTCVSNAQKQQSCSALKQCSLPPPPPPPPPPTVCPQVCSWLVNTCKLIPQNQYITCWATCQSQASSKITCAQTAMNANQCLQAVICLL